MGERSRAEIRFSFSHLAGCTPDMPLGCSVCAEYTGCLWGSAAVCNGTEKPTCVHPNYQFIVLGAVFAAAVIACIALARGKRSRVGEKEEVRRLDGGIHRGRPTP